MSNSGNADPRIPVTARQLRTWDFFETTLVVLLADGVFVLSAWCALDLVLGAYGSMNALSGAELQAAWLGLQGRWQGVGLIAAASPTIVVLWVAVRMAGRDFAEYLALNWPTRGEVWRAFGITAVVVLAGSFAISLVGLQEPVLDSYRTVGGPGGLIVLLIGGCIAGPIVEEFVVRGFMFRGWSESFLGPIGAIVLTSALWAMNHTQYDWSDRLPIFVLGLLLGHFRWRSNSTWLTVMLHSALNTTIFFGMGPYV